MTASFPELVDAWVGSQASRNTRAAYRADLARFAAWWHEHRGRRSPVGATAEDIESFRADCHDGGASAPTVARRVSALSSFFRYAATVGAVAASPVPDGRPPAPTATPTADLGEVQREALIRASTRRGDRVALLVALLLFDGLKMFEVLAANVQDVTIMADGASLAVRRRGAVSERALDRRTVAALVAHVGDRKSGPLLLGASPTSGPQRLTRYGADYLLKQVSADAGLRPAVSANTLRRNFVTTSHAAGASIEEIRDHLGHTDVRTTRRHLAER